MMHSSRSLRGRWPSAFVWTTLLTLCLPGCTTTSTPSSDGAFGADGGMRPDAVLVLPDGASVHADGGVSDDATMTPDMGLVTVDAAPAPDSALPARDGGHDAATFSGDAWRGVCGDGFIDPPETCDPAYAGNMSHAAGVHNSLSCPAAGSTDACHWCRYGLTPAGCVYGDYLYDGSGTGVWASSCRSTTSVLSWVLWHSAAERDAIIAAYRSISAGGGTTDVSGWVGLWAVSDTGSFMWGDDGSTLNSETILPIHNTRGPGANCMMLTVTDADAYFTYAPCSGGGRTALCFTQPWGTVR